MSDQENQPPTPPRPTIKTSAVPLKKETVRITLRPSGPLGEAPPPPPVSATAPIPAAPTAPTPPAPRPVAPTVPLAPPPRPVIPGAPPSAGPPRPAPPSAIGSKTIPLSQPPARPTVPMTGKPTAKIGTGSPTTQPLPRATVKLQPTNTPSAAISSVNVRTAVMDDDEEVDDGPLNIMGWIALVGAIVTGLIVWATWDKAPGEMFAQGVIDVGANPSKPQREDAIKSWKSAPNDEGLKLNVDFSPFDSKNEDGKVASHYDKDQPRTPDQPEDPYKP